VVVTAAMAAADKREGISFIVGSRVFRRSAAAEGAPRRRLGGRDRDWW
jgi:hypothetical protein